MSLHSAMSTVTFYFSDEAFAAGRADPAAAVHAFVAACQDVGPAWSPVSALPDGRWEGPLSGPADRWRQTMRASVDADSPELASERIHDVVSLAAMESADELFRGEDRIRVLTRRSDSSAVPLSARWGGGVRVALVRVPVALELADLRRRGSELLARLGGPLCDLGIAPTPAIAGGFTVTLVPAPGGRLSGVQVRRLTAQLLAGVGVAPAEVMVVPTRQPRGGVSTVNPAVPRRTSPVPSSVVPSPR